MLYWLSMNSIFLNLHIAGSLVFIAYMLRALWQLAFATGSTRRNTAWAVSIGSFQVVTGLALSLVNPAVTILAVCMRGLFLVVALAVITRAVQWRVGHQTEATY